MKINQHPSFISPNQINKMTNHLNRVSVVRSTNLPLKIAAISAPVKNVSEPLTMTETLTVDGVPWNDGMENDLKIIIYSQNVKIQIQALINNLSNNHLLFK